MRKARPHPKARSQVRARVGEDAAARHPSRVTRKLIACAKRVAKRLDVFVYFDNDAKVYAPFDAQRLAERLGVK